MTDTMIGIIGLIATIVFGVASIAISIWFYRRKKRPCKIMYLAVDCINLYSKLSIGLNSIELKAKGQKIDTDLLFVSGVFVCNGHADINGTNHKIRIDLPDNCKWTDLKVSSKSEELYATVSINQADPNKAKLRFDQFRMGEFITIKGLVECKNFQVLKHLYNFHNQLKFHHRIENTENIEVGEDIKKQAGLLGFLLKQIPFVLMIVLIIYSMVLGLKISPITFENIETGRIYSASMDAAGNVRLRDDNFTTHLFGRDTVIVTPKEFRNKYRARTNYERFHVGNQVMFVGYSMMLVLLFLFLYKRNRFYFRNRKLVQMYVADK